MSFSLHRGAYPHSRPRRLRAHDFSRRLVRENRLTTDDLILPLFVIDGQDVKNPIPSMPGHYQLSIDNFLKTAREAYELGIPAIVLFGIPDKKDALGTSAYAQDGIVQKAVKAIKKEFKDLIVITDLCLCEFTDHGHCGVVRGGEIDNDATLPLLASMAVAHARAGADVVAPSDERPART